MSFSRWLRATSEHYLMVAAQQKMAVKYHVTPPRRPRRAEVFWLRVYVPAYRAVPWPARSALMRRMASRRLPAQHMDRLILPRVRRPAAMVSPHAGVLGGSTR